jgi:hypothetical protein
MKENSERNLGEQPIATIMRGLELTSHDLVTASTEQITHKMVSRACKGRRLTSNTKIKICNSINKATEKEYSLKELFNY